MELTTLTQVRQGHLAMLAFSALVAGSFSFGGMIANKVDPVAIMAVRFILAGGIIGAAAALTTGIRREYFRAPWRYVVLGALFALYFVLMFEGLKTASPVSTAAVFTLIPILSALFGWIFMRQTMTRRMVLALAIGGVGAMWVIFRADLSAALAFDLGRGEAIYFVGCVFHAAYTPLLKKLNRGEPALVFNFAIMLMMVLLLCAYGGRTIITADWVGLGLSGWLIMFYLALFASAFTFVLIRFSAQHLPAAKVMAYTYLTPSWVICWEIILGNGVPGGMILVGIAMTILALVLLLKNEH